MARLDVNDLPHFNSPAEHWQGWYEALRAEYGKAKASRYFLERWQAQGASQSDVANTSGLRLYMQEQGVNLTGNWVGSSLLDFGSGAYSSASKGFNTISIFYVLGIFIVLALLGFVIYSLVKPTPTT